MSPMSDADFEAEVNRRVAASHPHLLKAAPGVSSIDWGKVLSSVIANLPAILGLFDIKV